MKIKKILPALIVFVLNIVFTFCMLYVPGNLKLLFLLLLVLNMAFSGKTMKLIRKILKIPVETTKF